MMNLLRDLRPEPDPRDADPARRSHGLPRRAPVLSERLRRIWRGLRMLPLGLGLAAAGCSMRSDLEFTSLMNEVPSAQAIMVPPPGGPGIVSVLERRYLNGVSQEISLSTTAGGSGQNTFWISLVNDPRALTENDDSLSIGRLDPLKIYGEIQDRLPGIGMQTSNYYVQNRYGPFGYAVGRSGAGDTCLYAWQLIEPTEPAIFMTSGTISVRMRVCEAGATEQQLLRIMYGYTIAASFKSPSWDPYGAPPPASPQLGQIDSPIDPFGAVAPGVAPPARIVPQAAPVARPVTRRRTVAARPRPAAVVAPTVSGPTAGYPVVPPPPR